MSTGGIRIYILEEMRAQGHKEGPLVALGDQLIGTHHTAQEFKPLLDGIEEIIDDLQSLHDRCCEKFPDAEADGKTDPSLAYLRGLINKWHIVWEGWNIPLE